MAIRPAIPADVPELVALGARFFAASPFAEVAPYDPGAVRALVEGAMHDGVVLVALDDVAVVGGIMGVLRGPWFAPSAPCAVELAWWVDEAARGSVGVRLYRAFEAWAREHGAVAVVMSDLVVGGDAPAAALYARLGYTLAERSHIKRLAA